ncbi:gamma carbonic anhydrase family protein [Haloplanus sp.]|uniref:gamma carbonic anhydrase family protein n=1 Tax=Haloplanus sp. TaxID=1961696 RepID=UPI00262123AE|nr:gamma carbonic anhydrase family protein [Haloplanus sp.]
MEREVMGESPSVADSAFVSEMAYLVGDVDVGTDASLWPFVCLRGDIRETVVGAGTNVHTVGYNYVKIFDTPGCRNTSRDYSRQYQEFSMLHGARVGDRVTVGHNVVIDHADVGDDALIGMSSTVQFDARVESNSLVAAGSLVTEDTVVPEGHLAYGVPAETRELTPEQAAVIEETADHYLKNRRVYKAAGGLEQ